MTNTGGFSEQLYRLARAAVEGEMAKQGYEPDFSQRLALHSNDEHLPDITAKVTLLRDGDTLLVIGERGASFRVYLTPSSAEMLGGTLVQASINGKLARRDAIECSSCSHPAHLSGHCNDRQEGQHCGCLHA